MTDKVIVTGRRSGLATARLVLALAAIEKASAIPVDVPPPVSNRGRHKAQWKNEIHGRKKP